MDLNKKVKVYSVNKTHSIKCKFYDIKVNQHSNNIWCFLPVFYGNLFSRQCIAAQNWYTVNTSVKDHTILCRMFLCNYPTAGSCAERWLCLFKNRSVLQALSTFHHINRAKPFKEYSALARLWNVAWLGPTDR